MSRLSEQHKRFITTALARYHTPSEVVTLVREEFEQEVTRQQVARYDPTRPAGEKLSSDLAELFHAERARFLADVKAQPIAHIAFRLRKLSELLHQTKSPKLAAELLEQAAKEVGGMFTNRRELSGPGGKPIAISHSMDLSLLSDEELAALERIVEKASPEAAAEEADRFARLEIGGSE